MNQWGRKVGLIVCVAATIAFCTYSIQVLRAQDLSRFANPPVIASIGLATVLYSLIIPISALAWRRMLADLGENRSFRQLATILGITQIAKYLPGNVGHHVGRASMALSSGIKLGMLIATATTETIVAILSAAAVGLAGISLARAGVRSLDGTLFSELAVASILATGILVILLGSRHVFPFFLKRLPPKYADRIATITPPGSASMVWAFVAYTLNFLVVGAGTAVMAHALLPNLTHDNALLTGAFALAWAAGFVAPGAPAGLGIREGAMLAVLQTTYSQSDALIVIVATRLATTAGDALCFLVGSALQISSRHSKQQVEPAQIRNCDNEP